MAETVIEARRLSKSYLEGDKQTEVLHAADLGIRAGEFLVILGPSGSGKSTLLNLLGLMDRPSAGEVILFDQKTSSLNERRRAGLRNRRIGFIFQFDSLLPEFTVAENTLMPGLIGRRRTHIGLATLRARARKLLADRGILELSDRFPAQLSGGERQRAAIARALINKPAVLFADEPTGNLDRHNGELVFKELGKLAKDENVAVVLVTHNEHAAQFASRTIHLIDGQISNKTEAS